jgi:hypothetical protein
MNYLIAFLVTFGSVFLKGFQHKNVIGGHMRLIMFTSYGMACLDVIGIYVVVKGGWTVAFASGTAGALAMVASIKLHDRIFKK